jgi:hypothetical protein
VDQGVDEMSKKIEYCGFSGDEMIPPCPVKDCPAWAANTESKCAFIELRGKSKFSKHDVAHVFGLSDRAADRLIKEAKGVVTDAARIVVPALRIEPKGEKLKLGGDFFENLPIKLTKNQLSTIRKDKSVNAALRRRMLPGQFVRYVGNKNSSEGE